MILSWSNRSQHLTLWDNPKAAASSFVGFNVNANISPSDKLGNELICNAAPYMFPALSIPAEAEMKRKRGIWFYFMQMCDDMAKPIA